MNKDLEQYARTQLKRGLACCTEAQQHVFKRMYSHKNLTKDINQVVDDMDVGKLDWAMSQVQRSVDDNKAERLAQGIQDDAQQPPQ